MTNENDERSQLGRDEARFVERLASHYAPEPLGGAQQAAFDARLRERLEARRSRWTLAPALVAASVTVVVAWAMVPFWSGDGWRDPAPDTSVSSRSAPSAWERRLFYGDVALRMENESEELPPDYTAIESLFLDG